MMAGLLLLVRRRAAGSDGSGLIDGLIVAIGLSLPSWVMLMAPYLHQDDLSLAAKAVSVAYPLGDVVLLGAAVRLALDGGRRERSFHLLTSSIVVLLATDFAYGLLTLHGGYAGQLWLDAGWIASYLLWGAAALHPSMRRIDEPQVDREVVLTRFRLALLTCGSMIAPVIGLVHDLARRQHRLRRGPRRLDHPVRPGRAAHGRPRAPAGALAGARARAQRRRRRPGGGLEPRGDRPRRGRRRGLARGRPRRRRAVRADGRRRAARRRLHLRSRGRAARRRGRRARGGRGDPPGHRRRRCRRSLVGARVRPPRGDAPRGRGRSARSPAPPARRRPRRPPARWPPRWRSRSTARCSPRRSTAAAARRASARSCATPATS